MMYWKYLRYLLRHRWFVMLACFREGLYWQGLIHDWSKFLPSEFLPYARYFYSPIQPGETIYVEADNSGFNAVVVDTRPAWHGTKDTDLDCRVKNPNPGQPSYWMLHYEIHDRIDVKAAFNAAWLAHQHRNPHHWQHWVLREDSGATFALPMPQKYRVEMLCDWQGAGRAIHGRYDANDPYGETRKWYKDNVSKMVLHADTRAWVEAALGIQHDKEDAS